MIKKDVLFLCSLIFLMAPSSFAMKPTGMPVINDGSNNAVGNCADNEAKKTEFTGDSILCHIVSVMKSEKKCDAEKIQRAIDDGSFVLTRRSDLCSNPRYNSDFVRSVVQSFYVEPGKKIGLDMSAVFGDIIVSETNHTEVFPSNYCAGFTEGDLLDPTPREIADAIQIEIGKQGSFSSCN